MSSTNFISNTWKEIVDKRDELARQENINKVTLPVGMVVGVIGILAALWLIWCILGGCAEASSSSTKSTKTMKSIDKTLSTGFFAKPSMTSAPFLIPESVNAQIPLTIDRKAFKVEPAKMAPLLGSRQNELLRPARELADAMKNMTEQTGGGSSIQGMPFVVLVIMMLVVRAKLTENR
jgi:hypothetical protein